MKINNLYIFKHFEYIKSCLLKVNKKEIRLSAMSSLNAEKEEGSILLFDNAKKIQIMTNQ